MKSELYEIIHALCFYGDVDLIYARTTPEDSYIVKVASEHAVNPMYEFTARLAYGDRLYKITRAESKNDSTYLLKIVPYTAQEAE